MQITIINNAMTSACVTKLPCSSYSPQRHAQARLTCRNERDKSDVGPSVFKELVPIYLFMLPFAASTCRAAHFRCNLSCCKLHHHHIMHAAPFATSQQMFASNLLLPQRPSLHCCCHSGPPSTAAATAALPPLLLPQWPSIPSSSRQWSASLRPGLYV
jgi:hypothetical protein